jgi:two-component system cell cycle response regulator CpdR
MSTILLVEPDSTVRDLLLNLLEDAGYTVVTHDSGEGALARLEDGCKANLLVTEVHLPKLDGWQLAQSARRLCPGLPAVFIPAHDRSRSKRGRRSFVLPKPFGARAFLIAVSLMAAPLVTFQ